MFFGLYHLRSKTILPLYSFEINVNIQGKYAYYNIKQKYRNITDAYLDAVFLYPKHLCPCFGNFEVKIGYNTIKTIVKSLSFVEHKVNEIMKNTTNNYNTRTMCIAIKMYERVLDPPIIIPRKCIGSTRTPHWRRCRRR